MRNKLFKDANGNHIIVLDGGVQLMVTDNAVTKPSTPIDVNGMEEQYWGGDLVDRIQKSNNKEFVLEPFEVDLLATLANEKNLHGDGPTE